MCGGAGTVICGEPRVAAECRCTEREFGWCARPTVRPGRTVHDDRDHGDGSDTRPRGRRTNGSLTETSVRDWPYWRERFDGSADRHMNPGPLDGTDPGPGTSSPRASSQTDRSTSMAIRPWSSLRRATRPSCPVVRRRGRGTRPPGRSCDGRDAAGARGPLSHDPDVVLAGQRSRGQGWDRVIGAVSSHLRAARASLLRNAPPVAAGTGGGWRGALGSCQVQWARGRRGQEERPPERPWISISPEIMSHAVWLYHRFDVRFRDAADLLAQHGLTVSDDAIRLWCLDFDSADARRLTRRQGRLGDIWHRDKVFVRDGSVTQNWGSLFCLPCPS